VRHGQAIFSQCFLLVAALQPTQTTYSESNGTLLLSQQSGTIAYCKGGGEEASSCLLEGECREYYSADTNNSNNITQQNLPTMTNNEKTSAKFFLGLVALFLGELRDGLTMINMQSAFLIVSKSYTEKQAGILFFVFGISQFIFQTPAGYIMDYTDWKVGWLAFASISTTLLTLLTATTATEYGGNIGWMIFLKFLQGGVTALIPPGLNSITQGIVGSNGMTRQVSDNEMRNHFGTAIVSFVYVGCCAHLVHFFVCLGHYCFYWLMMKYRCYINT